MISNYDVFQVALDAMRYRMGKSRADKAQSAKPKPSQPNVQRPGMRGGVDAAKASQLTQLATRAKTSGNIDDVLAYRMATKQ